MNSAIVYVCDRPYLPYLRKSVESVKRYNKGVQIAVVSRENYAYELPKGVVFHGITPDTANFKYKFNDRMQEGVYYKFYLPKLPYDKILYIDCDVICQRPLNDLLNEKCEFICATESHQYGKIQAQELGLKRYALTGMMLMNLDALRKSDFTKRCLDRLAKINPSQHDETVINLEFNDKIRFIDVKYNYCRSRKYDNPILESDAYLLHYVGRQKADMLLGGDFDGLERIKPMLKGKRVAIVGNSSALLNKGQGEEIDGHDIVIRFNKGFPNEKVGKKTDLLFLACTLTEEELSRFGARYTIRRSKLCGNNCDFKISKDDRNKYKQGSAQPSTGFLAVNFALSCACKEINLYGFDFFKNATYYNPIGYQTRHNGGKEEEKILEYEKAGLINIL